MGIMNFTKVVLNNLKNKPVTEMYPIKKRQYYDITRGHVEITIDNCIFCGICSKKCPTAAISVSRGEKSWEINRLRCIQCNCCVESCPKKCLNMENEYTETVSEGKIDLYIKENK